MQIDPKTLFEHRIKKGLSQKEVADFVGIAQRTYSSYEKGEMKPKQDKIPKLLDILGIQNSETSENIRSNIIPLYDDMGKSHTDIENENPEGYYPSENIDAGDLFPGATAAIRHYNQSMLEYPSGCILALQEIHKPYNFIWGEDYVIEYGPYRVVKRIQQGNYDSIRAYSTNTALHIDGTAVYQPIDIPIEEIKKAFLVLGHIIKRHVSGLITS